MKLAEALAQLTHIYVHEFVTAVVIVSVSIGRVVGIALHRLLQTADTHIHSNSLR